MLKTLEKSWLLISILFIVVILVSLFFRPAGIRSLSLIVMVIGLGAVIDPGKDEGAGHWVQLLEYDSGKKYVKIYDPFTNRVIKFGEGEKYNYDTFSATVWGNALVADR